MTFSNNKITVVLVGLLVLSLFTLPAFGASGDKYGGTLVVGSSQTFRGFNPMFDRENYSMYVISQMFDNLITLKPDTLEPAPYLAKSWDISENGKVIIWHLREGVKFHNGEDLTAEDVKFTYDWCLDKEHGSPVATYLAWLEEVQVVNEYTFKFIIKDKWAPFAPAIISNNVGIVPKDTFQEMGADKFRRNPVGSGPFEFEEWKQGDHVKLVRNEDYWLTKPYLKKVIFKPIPKLPTMMLELEKGEVDITDNMVTTDIPRFKKMDKVKVAQAPSVSYFWLGFNLRKEPFSDIRFRKAVYHSFSMDQAVHSIFKGLTGKRTYGVLPPSMWANDQEYLKSLALKKNPEKADELFNELREEGVMPKDFSPVVYSPPDPRRKKLATIVATSLKQHGIDASVQSLEWGSYMDLTFRNEDNPEGDFGMYFFGWADQPDPHNFLYHLFHSENARVGGYNSAGFQDPLVDFLLEKGASSMNRKVRELAYVAAQRLVIRSYAHIPAYLYIETKGVRSKVQGFTPDPTGGIRLVDPFTNVWVES